MNYYKLQQFHNKIYYNNTKLRAMNLYSIKIKIITNYNFIRFIIINRFYLSDKPYTRVNENNFY